MNPMDIFKNFQNLQSRVGGMQERMQGITATGTAGGDMVRVEIDGQMEVRNISISREVVDPEDISMLEDLVLAAFSDASAKVREKMREEMSSITGGLDLPPGFPGT